MKILVTGANGQLGSEIRALASSYANFNFFFADVVEVDICDYKALKKYVLDNGIQAVINCAAYTAVDNAEADVIAATNINVSGVGNLVAVIGEVNGKLIHISTDYVFDGNQYKPYIEEDKVNPTSVYGKTKLAGEQKVLNASVNGIVIRTSWLYSSFGNNFVKTMMRLGNEREVLGVVFDQVGTPTYAKDLAVVCLNILFKKEQINQYGNLYHYSNEGVASWYDFSLAIMQLANIDCKVKPIETKEYPTPAKRPFYSVLNKSKIKSDFQIEIPFWRDSLNSCIRKLQKKR
jgi:dTDP-4-dehydrorhamnose reductase